MILRGSAALLAALAGPAVAQDGAVAEFIDSAHGAEVVMIGEVHDNPDHHRVQAEVVAALDPGAIVFEMIPQALEDVANVLRADGASQDEFAAALEWEARGWPDFTMYAPIFEAAPAAQIFGAAQDPEAVRLAVQDGAAAAFGIDAEVYGLDRPLPGAEMERREAEMAVAHCDTLPEAMLPGMVEAQRFRDAALADSALWARTIAGDDAPVVVIAGNGHVDRRHGVPALIAEADPEVSVAVFGQGEGGNPAPEGAFDAYVSSPAPDRGDPCEPLRNP